MIKIFKVKRDFFIEVLKESNHNVITTKSNDENAITYAFYKDDIGMSINSNENCKTFVILSGNTLEQVSPNTSSDLTNKEFMTFGNTGKFGEDTLTYLINHDFIVLNKLECI